MKLYFDKGDIRGCFSLWVGRCDSRDTLVKYAFSQYEEDYLTPQEFQKDLEMLFIPENANREVENDFKEHFSAGSINHFQYDFAIVFDEDISSCDVLPFYTTSLRELLSNSSYIGSYSENLLNEFENKMPIIPEKCNSFILVRDTYDGYYSYIKKKEVELWYLGTVAIPF